MRILRQAEKSVAEVCREYEITEQTLYRRRRKYDNMDLSDAKPLKSLARLESSLEEHRREAGT